MSKLTTLKVSLQNTNWSDVSVYSSIILKITAILFLFFSAVSLVNLKLQFSHTGPSCDSYKDDFEYWINDSGKKKNKVLSVETSRVQLKNGTSSCFGFYANEQGNYMNWSGEVTQLDNGEIIGKAN